MRTTRDLSHTPTRTHDRQLRSCGVAAATHTGGGSSLSTKHAASVSGRAAPEQRWSSCELKSSVRPKRECTRTHTFTRTATAKLRCRSGDTGWWLFDTDYQTCGERERKRGGNKQWSSHAHTRPHERQLRSCGGALCKRACVGSTLGIKQTASGSSAA